MLLSVTQIFHSLLFFSPLLLVTDNMNHEFDNPRKVAMYHIAEKWRCSFFWHLCQYDIGASKSLHGGKASQECRRDKSVKRGKAYSSGENSKTRDRRQNHPFFNLRFLPSHFLDVRARNRSDSSERLFSLDFFNFVIFNCHQFYFFPYTLFFLSLVQLANFNFFLIFIPTHAIRLWYDEWLEKDKDWSLEYYGIFLAEILLYQVKLTKFENSRTMVIFRWRGRGYNSKPINSCSIYWDVIKFNSSIVEVRDLRWN